MTPAAAQLPPSLPPPAGARAAAEAIRSAGARLRRFAASLSIRYKIAAVLVAVLSVAISALGLYDFAQQRRLLQAEPRRGAEALVEQLAGIGLIGLLVDDDLHATAVVRDMRRTSGA